jgi:hypothetical protein
MNASRRNRLLIVGIVCAVAASGLVGAAVRYGVSHFHSPAVAVGAPTGEFDRGLPVYRLAPVDVTVTRSEALGRIEREEAMAAAAAALK